MILVSHLTCIFCFQSINPDMALMTFIVIGSRLIKEVLVQEQVQSQSKGQIHTIMRGGCYSESERREYEWHIGFNIVGIESFYTSL